MATNKEIQNLAAQVFASNGWIDSPGNVVKAKNFKFFDAFTERLELSEGIQKLKVDNFQNYLFLMARDYFSLGYAAVYQQVYSDTPYYKLDANEIEKLLDEIWEVGAFEYSIGPMGDYAKSTTQDICLMAQSLESKYVGDDELKKKGNMVLYNKAFYNIGLTMGYIICASHL